MMRPKRCFIIGRIAARLSRNTALRLVSSTASQSSSFMRMASVSRVIPALFTSTCRPPCCFDDAVDQGFHRGGIVHIELGTPATRVSGQCLTDARSAFVSGGGAYHRGSRARPIPGQWRHRYRARHRLPGPPGMSSVESVISMPPSLQPTWQGQTKAGLSVQRQSASSARPIPCPAPLPPRG